MRALVFDEELRYVTDHADPTPEPGEALIHVHVAGICNTDIELTKGYLGFDGALGHEFVGVVERVADEGDRQAAAWVGKRVVGEINCPCLECPVCEAGMPEHCPNRTVLGIQGRDGAFADYLCLPVRNLHQVPRILADDEAVFVEPLAAAYEILEQVEIEPGLRVAVLGDGKLGMLVAQVLAQTECDLTVIGKHFSKLAMLNARDIKTAAVGAVSDGPYDMVVDCTGSTSGFESALRLVQPRGTIVLKSTLASASAIDLAPIVVNEVTVVGSRCGPFSEAIDALQNGQVGVHDLVTAKYPLADAARAFEHAQEKGALKVLLDMQADS